MKNIRNYSTKEKILISFSFWPTLLIGIALGLTIALLMLQNPQPIYLLISQIKFIVGVLVALGVLTRGVSIYLWRKYEWSFTSNLK
ncbi:MAG: hypothetical protein HN733_03380 [Gammaproteobacteria bacterium]|nr:hypothetical protein [Gammaproteobacteria bacterium]